MSDIIVAPETRDLSALDGVLRHWLASKIPEARTIRLANLAYPRGAGQSHETILFDVAWEGADGLREMGCVLRIKPGSFTVFPDDLFAEQYRVMQAVAASGLVRVAAPLWFEEDPAVLGKPFFIMEKMTGRVPVSVPPYAETGWVAEASAAQRRRMWESGVGQLAAIQRVPLAGLEFLEGPPHAPRGTAQELDKYRRFVSWVQEDKTSREAVGAILEAGLARLVASAPVGAPEGLVWGDARLGNMMFDNDFNVIAVMDWEQPSLGGALQDLAWWLVLSETMHGRRGDRPHLAGMGTRAETIELWEELSGKSAAGIEWFEDFTRLKMSCTGVRIAALRQHNPPDSKWLAQRLKVA